jgi:hypothetical protein
VGVRVTSRPSEKAQRAFTEMDRRVEELARRVGAEERPVTVRRASPEGAGGAEAARRTAAARSARVEGMGRAARAASAARLVVRAALSVGAWAV